MIQNQGHPSEVLRIPEKLLDELNFHEGLSIEHHWTLVLAQHLLEKRPAIPKPFSYKYLRFESTPHKIWGNCHLQKLGSRMFQEQILGLTFEHLKSMLKPHSFSFLNISLTELANPIWFAHQLHATHIYSPFDRNKGLPFTQTFQCLWPSMAYGTTCIYNLCYFGE